jgi:hypothetical protein
MKNIVLINSKIVVSNNRLSYSATRSIFSGNERFLQTKATIESAKKHIPEPYIVFIDNSALSSDAMDYFKNEADLFLNPIHDDEMRHDTDINEAKAMGELSHIRHALNHIDKLPFEWGHLFKLCGRYVINEHFDYRKFDNDHNIFRVNEPLTRFKSGFLSRILTSRKTCYFTSFYKISRRNYPQYREAINRAYDSYNTNPKLQNEPLELILCSDIDDKTPIKPIGLTINCAVEEWVENI